MKISLLSRSDELVSAFRSALSEATSVDVAVAWATQCEPVSMLRDFAKAGGRLRVVVGRDFAGTDPRAVQTLFSAKAAQVRWAWKPPFSGVFHPKIFLFRSPHLVTAIVGSANLSRHAFLYNVEASMLFDGFPEDDATVIQLLRFFDEVWDPADEVTLDNLEEYAEEWSDHRPSDRETTPDVDNAKSTADELVGRLLTWSWDEYVTQLRRVDDLWRPFGGSLDSFLDMLEEVPGLTRSPLSALSKNGRLALCGIGSDEFPNAGWLGRMRGNGKARHCLVEDDEQSRTTQKAVSDALRRIPFAADSLPYASVIGDAYNALRKVPNIGSAIATRYLTLRRPDALLSVNGASESGLSKIFRLPASRLRQWNGYETAISELWKAPWMKVAKPSGHLERKLWMYRAALLDMFVYQPSSGEHPEETYE
jgi:HKD family nuclease